MVKALTIGFLVVAGTAAGLADGIEITEFTKMDCDFSNQMTTENGGAANILAGTLLATGTANFTNNSADQNGGAIYILAGTIANEDAINFSENSAENGGAIWAAAGTTISLNNATFSDNSASGNGGAIYGNGNLTLNLTGMTNFSGNADADGNGIYVAGTLNLNVESGEILDAIFAESGTNFKKTGEGDFSLNGAVSGDLNVSVAGTGILTLGENFSGTLAGLELAAESTIDFRGNAIFSNVETVSAGTLKFSAETTIFASDCDLSNATIYLSGGTISDDGAGTQITLGVAAAQGETMLDINADAYGIVAIEDANLKISADKNLAISNFGAADEISLKIDGAGTLTAQTDDDGELGAIAFVNTSESPSGNANFAVSASVENQTLNVGANTILTLGGNATDAAKISLAGTLKIEDEFTVETLESSTGTLAAGTLNVTNTVELSSSSSLEIAENATLAGTVLMTYMSASLTGAGTLDGNLTAERGTISIAKITGNLTTSANTRGPTISGTIAIGGNFENNATETALAAGTNLTTGGNFSNAGTLYILGATTLDVAGRLESTGTLYFYADGEISFADANQKIEFANGATIVLDVTGMSAGTAFDKIENLDENSLENVKISTISGTDISDRFRWDSLANSYIFLGLNGREIATTIYGDFLHEQTLQTLNFADAVLAQFNAQNVRKPLFGKTRKTSKYMRGFLERERQFDRTPDKPAIVPVSEENPGDFAKIAEKALCSAWAQFAGTTSTRDRDGAHPEYDLDSAAFILGTTVPAGEFWQFGLAGTYAQQTLETSGTSARHKLESDFYQLMAFARYSEKEGLDTTFAILGGTATTDSTRGNVSADFGSWQIGALMDIGLGFMPDPTSYFRTNFALEFAYAHHEKFVESGENYSVGSAHTAIGRTSFGVSYAFLPIDDLQISIGARAHYDFGPESSSVSGYDFATDSRIYLTGRKFSRFSGQFDLLGDYAFSSGFSVFAGTSYILRSDADELRATAGVRVKF